MRTIKAIITMRGRGYVVGHELDVDKVKSIDYNPHTNLYNVTIVDKNTDETCGVIRVPYHAIESVKYI